MIGDEVIWGGERFRVRGVDPAGVDPRCIYLEHARTGKVISVTIEEVLPLRERRRRGPTNADEAPRADGE